MAKSTATSKNKSTTRILKKSNCPKLAPKAKGSLTYHIGYNETAKTYLLRITANTGGGFFSNEWIALGDILETIESAEFEDSFKAIIRHLTFNHPRIMKCYALKLVSTKVMGDHAASLDVRL